MRSLPVLSVLLLFLPASPDPEGPNDSVLKGKGGHLVPVEETDIDLRREVLNMRLEGDEMLVDVHFEFFNPGDTKTLTVGFVTPPVSEGAHALEGEGSPIDKFQVIANGKELGAEVQKLGESEFQSDLGTEWADFDYVHYFQVEFDPGLNILKHSYSYGGRQGAMGDNDYPYRLTTGKNWANGTIEDFTLNLDMGQGLFYVSSHFEEGANGSNWEVIGRGRTEMTDRNSSELKAYTGKDGYLSFQKKDFSPDRDLSISYRNFFGMFKPFGPILLQKYAGGGKADPLKEMGDILTKRGLSKEERIEKLKEFEAAELRILRNAFFAVRGYDFNDEELQAHYEEFFWYIPDREVGPSMEMLSPKEREWVRTIQELEEEKSRE